MRISSLLTVSALLALFAGPAQAQGMEDVEIRTEHAAGDVYVLFGQGGNIGVLPTPRGIILVDDQYAPLTERIKAAVAEIDDGPIRFVLNTHWHPDHTGGNEKLGELGTVIVAHDNVHKRMSSDQFIEFFDSTVPAASLEALPVVTFNHELSFRLGEQVRIYHIPHAHTDGDSLVHFTESNVIHMGDLMFRDRYPFIDLDSGGNLAGVIDGIERAREIADEATVIIPGHGTLGDVAALERYHAMLVAARDRVGDLMAEGRSLEEILEARPMADYDEAWGGGFIGPEAFLRLVHESLEKQGHRH